MLSPRGNKQEVQVDEHISSTPRAFKRAFKHTLVWFQLLAKFKAPHFQAPLVSNRLSTCCTSYTEVLESYPVGADEVQADPGLKAPPGFKV